jgi:predicted RND superfamily exporter protein
MMASWLEVWGARGIGAAMWLSVGYRPLAVVAGTCGVFAVAALLFFHGAIPNCTRALEFIRGTLVEREARLLNQPGNVGFEFLDLLVEPTQGARIADPHFLARAWELQTALKTVPGSRETTSILGTLHQIAQESFKKSLPENDEEVAAAFFLIENRLALAVQRQLYFPGGVRISVSYGTDDSVELGRFRDAILALAQWSFPDLKVSAFNKVPLYPQVDRYVREGKVSNVFASQVGIAILCAAILWWRNQRLRRARLSPVLGGITMSLPLFFATGVMGLTMWFFRIPLDMATAPIGALAINAATDFSLYLALTYQQLLDGHSPLDALRQTLEMEGKVILADCLLNTCCFHFLPVRQLGWMMGLMLVSCAVGSLLFMAALLPSCVTQKEPHCDKALVPVRSGVRRLLAFLPRGSRADSAGDRPVGAPTAFPFR